jgi:hypothetical protein
VERVGEEDVAVESSACTALEQHHADVYRQTEHQEREGHV